MERRLTNAERKDRHNRELCTLAKQGDPAAQTELLLENEGLMVQLAKSLEVMHDLDVNHYGGIELDDLLQEGRLAILEAAVSYDVNSDTKFSTYASTVMRNTMRDLCRKAASSFERQLADNGIPQVFLNDDPVDGDGVPECEKVQDGRIRDPAGDEAVQIVMVQKLYNRLKALPVREKKVIIRRYGIGEPEPLTVPEAAAYFHLSDKLLLNIEKHALKILMAGMNDGEIL